MDGVEKVLQEAGVENIQKEDRGKARLAYPIKHIRYGYFYRFDFVAEPDQISGIQEKLRLDRQLLRAIISIFNPEKRAKMQKAIERAQVQQVKQKKEASEKATVKNLQKPEAVSEPKKVEEVKESKEEVKPTEEVAETKAEEVVKEEKTTEQPKASTIEQLDKQLDEILDKTLENV